MNTLESPVVAQCFKCQHSLSDHADEGGSMISCLPPCSCKSFQTDRPSWDDYFMDMAKLVATRATCPVRQVGAVFVDQNNSVLSVGYNGAPRGTEHCGMDCYNREHGQRTSQCRAVHSETNAILNAARNGIKLEGSKVYVTLSPCKSCAGNLIQVGVSEVVFAEESAYPHIIEELKQARIIVKTIK